MCGIIGYTGKKEAASVIISGLRRLEYRGYDSAGLAVYNRDNKCLDTVKTAGKVDDLQSCAELQLTPGSTPHNLGIGHTRWATHGPPTSENAHPHLSASGNFAIAHNGIIENYSILKKHLAAEGVEFASETDSEVLAHLIEQFYDGDLTQAVAAALAKVEGTYGIAVVSSLHPDLLVTSRKGSPIAVGVCNDETVVASDISAIVQHTDRVIFLNDGDILTATADSTEILSKKNVPISRELTRIDWGIDQIEKNGYDHFMLKEIHEQPDAISNTIRGRLLEEEGTARLSGMQMKARELAAIDRILIVACGTSLYAGMIGKYFFEEFAGIPTEVQQAAEFRYSNPIIQRNTCMLAVSQSGETADTLAAVREAARKGATVLSICNVVGSTIARETGRGVYLHAGPEIGVASTKAFSCQVTVMAMMAIIMGRTRRMSTRRGRDMVREIHRLPEIAREVLRHEGNIREVAEKYAEKENAFFIGRGYMYPSALEGALKLKEISYIHAEGYHAAELKHGPLALLDQDVPLIALVPDIQGKDKTINNMQESKARGAPVIAVATQGDEDIADHSDDVINLPRCSEFLTPVPVVIAEQLFAYYVAKKRGCEIDQPRNLAKSVTVE